MTRLPHGDTAPSGGKTSSASGDIAESVTARSGHTGSGAAGRQGDILPVILTLTGAVGLLASWLLAVDGWNSLRNPGADLMCALGAGMDCAPAMDTWQARLLGFPNAYLGIGAFTVLTVVGVQWLSAGAPARWFRRCLLLGSVAGMALVWFLMYTTVSSLPALCPWCLVVWIAMWPALLFQVDRGMQVGDVPASPGLARAVRAYRWAVLVVGYVLAAAVVVIGMPHLLR